MDGQTEQQGSPDSVEPRIYVASLSDYNNGHLHGCWIRAAQDPDLIYDEIHQMLATSPSPQAEEWAIHDYEGFTPHDICETADIPTITRIAMEIIQLQLALDPFSGLSANHAPPTTSLEESSQPCRSTAPCIPATYPEVWSIGSKPEISDTLGLEQP